MTQPPIPSEGGRAPRGLTGADLMTARQVAELLGVPLSTVQEWGCRGVLPRVKLGRHVALRSGPRRAHDPGATSGSRRAGADLLSGQPAQTVRVLTNIWVPSLVRST